MYAPFPGLFTIRVTLHAHDAWQMKKNFSHRSRASFGAFLPAHRYNVTTVWSIQVLPSTPAPSLSPIPSQLEELAWSEGTLGPEDMHGVGQRPEPPKPLPERMRLRVERQTLRRLPRSGAIVFTIRVYMTPPAELGPGEAGRLAAAIRGVKEQEAVYRFVCGSFRTNKSCNRC